MQFGFLGQMTVRFQTQATNGIIGLMAATVQDLLKIAKLDTQKRVKIFNPDSESFDCVYDGEKQSIPAQEFKEFKLSIAKHIAKHLANKILHQRTIKTNVEDTLKEIMEEIIYDN